MHKPVGIIKQMALNGSLVIPSELRDALSWQSGTSIIIYPFEDFLVLKTAPEKDLLLRDLIKAAQSLDEPALRHLLRLVRNYPL